MSTVAGLKKISNMEEVYFQRQAIKKQIIALENFVLAHTDREKPHPVKPVRGHETQAAR